MRSRKWKNKERRGTSHSYWSRTHGPSGDYSRHIRDASMAMDGLPEGVPPSGRVPGQLLQAARILKWRWRRYREGNEKSRSILWVSSSGGKYRRRGHQEGPQGSQEAPWRDLG